MAKTRTLAPAGALAALLLAAPAFAQDAADLSAWDADGDGTITQAEFDTGFVGTDAFARWDADASGGLSQDEFAAGYGLAGATPPDFVAWDADADGQLSAAEFGTGVFGGYDADASGSIEAGEQASLTTDVGSEGIWVLGSEGTPSMPEGEGNGSGN